MTAKFANIQVASLAGTTDKASEDWALTTPELLVVLDGATARTETGCVHGIAWYARHLGSAIVERATEREDLRLVLAEAIAIVAREHPECDLTHPGTPSAGVAILRVDGDYLVLGDVAMAAQTGQGLFVVVDDRVSKTAAEERAEVDRHLIGTPEKAAALIPMKVAELAARNVPGGYWIAAADPAAAEHALTGRLELPPGLPFALLSDGAARAVDFGLMTWEGILGEATRQPAKVLNAVRAAEASDPFGARWPRNKASDDATIVIATVDLGVS
jgi:hypothetical protein